VTREKIIQKYIKDKEVLDVGGVGQSGEYNLWQDMKSCAMALTGIDIVPSSDDNMVEGNMENYLFGRKFDVIVLGDVLEHVDNQGMLLDNCRKHLKEDGILIITTPNANWITVFLPTNPTHTLFHNRSTLSAILERHNFMVTEFRYYYGNKPYYNYLLRPFILRQQMLAICKINKPQDIK